MMLWLLVSLTTRPRSTSSSLWSKSPSASPVIRSVQIYSIPRDPGRLAGVLERVGLAGRARDELAAAWLRAPASQYLAIVLLEPWAGQRDLTFHTHVDDGLAVLGSRDRTLLERPVPTAFLDVLPSSAPAEHRRGALCLEVLEGDRLIETFWKRLPGRAGGRGPKPLRGSQSDATGCS